MKGNCLSVYLILIMGAILQIRLSSVHKRIVCGTLILWLFFSVYTYVSYILNFLMWIISLRTKTPIVSDWLLHNKTNSHRCPRSIILAPSSIPARQKNYTFGLSFWTLNQIPGAWWSIMNNDRLRWQGLNAEEEAFRYDRSVLVAHLDGSAESRGKGAGTSISFVTKLWPLHFRPCCAACRTITTTNRTTPCGDSPTKTTRLTKPMPHFYVSAKLHETAKNAKHIFR